MKKAMLLLTAAVAISFFCSGCEKFTRQRYEMVFNGQPSNEVENVLGEPYVKFENQWNYVHEDPFYSATIKFHEGKVVGKSWSDEKTIGNHPDGDAARRESAKPSQQQRTVVE